MLFNLHRACARGARAVIVVEGFIFDTFAVYHAGYPSVVALMGSTLSRHQADLLTTHFDRVLLMLDGDEAGRQGTAAVTSAFAGRIDVIPSRLDDGTQPDQLAAAAIQRLVGGDVVV